MSQPFIKKQIDTIFSWLYDGPQWSKRRPSPAVMAILDNPPKSALYSVQEAMMEERATVECLPVAPNADDAFWMAVQHYLESSKHLLAIAADVSGDNYSAEAITADDSYFKRNDEAWERALTAVRNEAQTYRLVVNQERFYSALEGKADPSRPEEITAAGQYAEVNDAMGLLSEVIEGRAEELRSAIAAQGKLKSMSPNGQAMCQFAAHMCDQAVGMVHEWRASLPNLPPSRGAEDNLPPMG